MKKFSISLILFISLGISQVSYAAGCSLTKSLYDSGKYSRALTIARTYAKYKDACAEYYLGLMYLGGKGVTADGPKGNEYISRSAKQGYQPAIDYLASVAP